MKPARVDPESHRKGFAPIFAILIGLISAVLVLITFGVYQSHRLVSDPFPLPTTSSSSSPQTLDQPQSLETSNIDQITANWKTYSYTSNINPLSSFTVMYPNDFRFEPPSDKIKFEGDGQSWSFGSPDLQSGDLATPVTRGGEIDIFRDKAIGDLDSQLKKLESDYFRVRSKSETQINGVPAYKGTGSFSGFNDGNYVICIKNGYRFLFLAKPAEGYQEKINATFDQILSTFKFLD